MKTDPGTVKSGTSDDNCAKTAPRGMAFMLMAFLLVAYAAGAWAEPSAPARQGGVAGSAAIPVAERAPRSKFVGSPYVPLDSWVYPLFDRLTALGYVQSGFASIRPWTRTECARLVSEAAAKLSDGGGAEEEARAAVTALQTEFANELRRSSGPNPNAKVESLYARVGHISGTPLTDGYHFGQTVINDFGRPYSRGTNLIAGGSAYASASAFVVYARGEYQQAPSIPALPAAARAAISQADSTPLQPGVPIGEVQRFEPLDSYVGVNLWNTQLTFGRQSLWWSPDSSGALMFSDNARPVTMIRMSQVVPFRVPFVSRLLGPFKHDLFFGQLAGHHYPALPYIYGQKLSFQPTRNLELGFSRMAVIGGTGNPLTLDRFFHSFFSTTSTLNPDPGDRRGGFDVRYRIPGLRKWVMLNVDTLVDDDPTPLTIGAPPRAAVLSGIYLPRIPGVPKLDFRAEAVYTDVPSVSSQGGKFIYWNGSYRDSHTQDGSLLGDWVGREGKGYYAVSNYWLGPRSKVALAYRNAQVAQDFIPGGATLHDATLQADVFVRHDVSLKGQLQYEHLNVPVLGIVQTSNFLASVQVTYWPHWKLGSTASGMRAGSN